MVYKIYNVREGYYKEYEVDKDGEDGKDPKILKRCTCSLIKGKINVLVNTMTPWDKDIIINALANLGLEPYNIHSVISTQPIYGFFGNNYLFENSYHIVGQTYARKNCILPEPFGQGNPLYLDGEDLQVIPTPGITLKDVSVLVKTADGTVAITGALFENGIDMRNNYHSLRYYNGSFYPQQQMHSRKLIMKIADVIIPGYGLKFNVTEEMRNIFLDRNSSLI